MLINAIVRGRPTLPVTGLPVALGQSVIDLSFVLSEVVGNPLVLLLVRTVGTDFSVVLSETHFAQGEIWNLEGTEESRCL